MSNACSTVADQDLPPGPATSPEQQTFEYFARPYEFLRACAAAYGDVFTVRFRDFGTHVVVADPESIRRVFAADPKTALAGTGNAILRPILGAASLLLLDGADHARVRRILMPPFYAQRMRAHAVDMRAIARAKVARWADGDEIAILRATFDLSLAVIVRVVLGEHARASEIAPRVASLMKLANTGGAFLDDANAARARFDQAALELDAALEDLVGEARGAAGGGNQGKNGGPERDSVLAMLVAARDGEGEPLSPAVLKDQLLTLLVAGHETTATAIGWALHLVHADRAVLVRLRAELDALGPSADVDAWTALPYLDAVCQETLRLRPVVPVVSRFLLAPLELAGGHVAPAGAYVTPSTYLAHHRADVFAEPDAFRPERFLEQRFTGHQYLPFGGGARRCLGLSFAIQEMKIALATMLTELDFTPLHPTSIRTVRRSVTVGPSASLRMRVRRRGLVTTENIE
jgi:cytochrome P450